MVPSRDNSVFLSHPNQTHNWVGGWRIRLIIGWVGGGVTGYLDVGSINGTGLD